jgi:serine/threonine-protein kinase
VLYEMLAGQPPHLGGSAQQIIMKIIAEPVPAVTTLRKSVPPNVAAAVAKALEKLPADRFDSAKAFAEALTDSRFTSAADGTPPRPMMEAARRAPVAAAGWGAAAILAVALGWRLFGSGPAQPARSIRFAFSLGTATSGSMEIEISPDGRRVVQPQGTGRPGGLNLTVRDLTSLEPSVLEGTPGGQPRVSPDGRWLAYSLDRELRKVPIGGGTPTMVSEHCGGGQAWLDAEALVCVKTDNWGLGRVSGAGGPVEELTVPDTAAGEIGHWAPDALPGGRVVLFTSYRRPASRIEAYDLSSRQRTVLVENAIMARYARSGHLLFVRDNALFAIGFDARTIRTQGTAVPVLEDVASRPSDAVAGFAIADNGTLVAIRQSEWTVPSRVVWVDRRGVEQPAIPAPREYASPRISPDQRSILVTVTTGHRDLWLYDVRRSLLTQLTRSAASAFGGAWSPDGREVVFTNETPSYDVYRMPLDGSAPPAPVVANVKDKYPRAISPDGATVAFEESWAGLRRVILAPLDGRSPGRAIGDSSVGSFEPSFSPDGRWIAYSEGGQYNGRNVFVRRTDGTGGKLQVSAGGEFDVDPRWTKGGREIVFRRRNAVYAVDIDVATAHVGAERRLFEGPYPVDRGYDVTPDGTRFLMVKVEERPAALPILVITNFFEELKKKVGQ